MDKITIIPGSVRGYGDVVSPKTLDDFSTYNSALNYEDGTYTLSSETKGVTLTVSSTSISYGESVLLTATAIDEGVPAVGETVTFYQGSTVLGTDVTGDDGKATYTVTGLSVGNYSFKAEYDIFESNTVNVTVNKLSSTITLASNKSALLIGDSFVLSGVLSVGSGVSVKLYNGNTLVDTVTTGTGGAFEKSITATGSGMRSYTAVYEGDSIHMSAISSIVNVNIVDSSNYISLGVTGSSFSSYSNNPFTYTGAVYVDWGDNTGLVEYTGGALSHTYSTTDNYSVKIYGNITSLGTYCFRNCTGLTCIRLPDTITDFGIYCFYGCTGLTEVGLNWDTSSEIIVYNSGWISGCTSFNHFLIPEGTTSLYTAKSYPSNLLKEEGDTPTVDSVSLTGDKSILSYADSESATLSATVLDSNDDPMEGVTVTFYNGSTSMGTADTNSSGVATKTYASTGAGDLSFTASVGTISSETYSIEDCYKYDTCTLDKTSSYTTPTVFRGSGTPLFTFESSYGYKFGKSSGNGDVWLPICDITGLTSYKVEFDQYSTTANNTSNTGALFYLNSTNYHEFFYAIQNTYTFFNLTCVNGSTNYTNPSASRVTVNAWMHYEITVTNGSAELKVTQNDTVLYQNTYTLAITPIKVGVLTGWSAGYTYVKNIKVKSL